MQICLVFTFTFQAQNFVEVCSKQLQATFFLRIEHPVCLFNIILVLTTIFMLMFYLSASCSNMLGFGFNIQKLFERLFVLKSGVLAFIFFIVSVVLVALLLFVLSKNILL